MSVNYYRHTPLLHHIVVRARCCHIRKNFEVLQRGLSDIGRGFAIIVNDGMLSGLS